VGPVIVAILEQAHRAVDEEVQRFMFKLDNPNGNEPVLRQLAQTVAHRVLHPALSHLGSAEAEAGSVEVIAEAFGVRVDE
jgi:glutamyl-tRNA reductase